MESIVQNYEDAFSIIWFDIHGWLEPKDSAWKADLCGVLTSKILGENIGSRVHVPAQRKDPYYQRIISRYRFGASIDELGKCWKQLIRAEDPFSLRSLLGCLKVYYEEIMPFAKNEMVDFFKRNGRTCPELSPTLKPYKEHRARIKETMRILEMVLSIFALRYEDEDEAL